MVIKKQPTTWKEIVTTRFPGVRDFGFALEPNASSLADEFARQGLGYGEAMKRAEREIKYAEGEEFLDNHPRAPRRWRILGRERKSF